MSASERVATVARVLSELYLHPPTPALRQALADPAMLQAWPLDDAASQRGIALVQGQTATAEDEARDHLYLFVGAGKPLAQPCESPYFSLDGLVFDDDTFAVRDWYRRYGLAAARTNMPDDHIGVQIAFIGSLVERGETQAAQEFLEAHLGRFVDQVLAGIRSHAISSTYQALAEFTEGFVAAVRTLPDSVAEGAATEA